MKQLQGDIIVAGGGAAGMCAALRIKQKAPGAAVYLLEKDKAPGGGAIYAPMPERSRYDCDPETAEAGYLSAMERNRWTTDARMVSTVERSLPDAIRWLYETLAPFSGQLARRLAAACDAAGVITMTDTRVQSLIRDGKGWSCGVVALRGGEAVTISARAVILACGGFLGNEELMGRYYPLYDDRFSSEIKLPERPSSGDGIRMALDAGAGDDCRAGFVLGTDPAPFYEGELGPAARRLIDPALTPEGVWVNNVGVRFVNEQAHDALQAVYRQPNKEFYVIFDAGVIEAVSRRDPRISREALDREMEALIDGDEAIRTDHLGALTAWVRGKTHILFHTLERYNECCEKGRDFLFGKEAAALVPFRKPPFYGFRLGLSIRGTTGPIRTNPMMAVVDRFDAPVPALIACGAMVAGLYPDGFVSGAGDGFIARTICTGMLAGDHGLGFLHGMGPAAPCEFPKFTAKQVLSGDYYNVGAAPPDFAVMGGIVSLQEDGSRRVTHLAADPEHQGLLRKESS